MGLNWRLDKARWKLEHWIRRDGKSTSEYGADFICTSWLDRYRVNTLMGESSIIDRLRKEWRSDDVIWDVGANIGIISCHLARNLTSGQIIAFEPVPQNAKRLQENLALNALSDRWMVQELCLGDAETTVSFPIFDKTVGAGGQSQTTEGEPTQTIKVNQRTGDGLIQSGAALQPDIVKLDVEGAEWMVLQGMESTLPSVRFLVIEVHPNQLSVRPETIHDALRDAGFDLEIADERGDEYHIFATQTGS